MKRLMRGTGYAAAGIALLAVLAALSIYLASERVLSRTHDVPLTWSGNGGPGTVAEGERLARIRGCYDGCHGRAFSGQVFFDEAPGRLVAPDLTRLARSQSDAELERVIRHGVRRDGRSVLAMPASMFYHLSDADLASMLAFLRSAPASNGPESDRIIRPLGRLGLVLKQFRPEADLIDHDAPRLAADPSDTLRFGEYLARTTCTECHGPDLRGDPSGSPPDLRMAAAYSPEDFTAFMRTGVALGGRELELMSEVARGRFRHFTDEEVHALHRFLVERAKKPLPATTER